MVFIYFVIFFSFCFLVPSLRVYFKTGINPITFKNTDSAHDLIGFYMKLVIASALISGFLSFKLMIIPFYSFPPEIGIFLMLTALMWVIVAQFQMASSWRIGIDDQNRTEIITNGLFKVSRNPIFLGMLVALFAVFIYDFNFINLINFLVAIILITIQVRLEEEFLQKIHGDTYLQYRKRTRRWL